MGRNGQRYLWWTPLVTVCASPSESPYRYCGDLAGQETLRTCSRTFGDRSTLRDWAKLSDAVLLSKTTAKSDSLGYNSSLRRDFPAWFHANGSKISIERPYCSLHTKFISPSWFPPVIHPKNKTSRKRFFWAAGFLFQYSKDWNIEARRLSPNWIPSV